MRFLFWRCPLGRRLELPWDFAYENWLRDLGAVGLDNLSI
jgi:hypothetical protein